LLGLENIKEAGDSYMPAYDTYLVYPLYYTDSYMSVYDRSRFYPDFLFII